MMWSRIDDLYGIVDVDYVASYEKDLWHSVDYNGLPRPSFNIQKLINVISSIGGKIKFKFLFIKTIFYFKSCFKFKNVIKDV